jgi:hypothetical protein
MPQFPIDEAGDPAKIFYPGALQIHRDEKEEGGLRRFDPSSQ